MHDFTQLLLSASMTMGTPLAVAKVLQVQPKLVYRWMAGLERPSFTDVNTSKQRLEQAFRTPKPTFAHARRRAFDPHLVPVPLAAAA
jgi:hypothetical protein